MVNYSLVMSSLTRALTGVGGGTPPTTVEGGGPARRESLPAAPNLDNVRRGATGGWSPAPSPEEAERLRGRNAEFRKIMAEGVEGHMHRNGLRNSKERNKIIDELYSAFKAGKEFSAEEIEERIAEAQALANLAAVLERRAALESGAIAKVSTYQNDEGYDVTRGAVLVASIEGGGSAEPQPGSAEFEALKKKQRRFWLDQASLVFEQQESKQYQRYGWRDEGFTQFGLPTMLEVPEGGRVEDFFSRSSLVLNGHGNETTIAAAGWGNTVANGRIPQEYLVPISDGGFLHRRAAESWEAMKKAAAAEGVELVPTGGADSYRDYDTQVTTKANKGPLAATPGRSNHGWAAAVDIQDKPGAFKWLADNAWKFGWNHPDWARPGGSKPEPWHWEFIGTENTAVAL